MWRWFEDDRGGMQALLYRRSVGFGVPSSGTENAGALSSFQRHRRRVAGDGTKRGGGGGGGGGSGGGGDGGGEEITERSAVGAPR
ncbi:hypothetical protein HZH68_003956 [Vespula germanica]|uniref:Uncharacterized protein n=1 Tax=Vespula germanica TaxID=30212 RepID=A0A834NGS6_VESGE|nr:hypothetical protein HZH68_003956 [Vespula germanica]